MSWKVARKPGADTRPDHSYDQTLGFNEDRLFHPERKLLELINCLFFIFRPFVVTF